MSSVHGKPRGREASSVPFHRPAPGGEQFGEPWETPQKLLGMQPMNDMMVIF